MSNLLELAAFSVEDALVVGELGVDRIEFCKDYHTGGLTPEVGDIQLFKNHFPNIPVFVMIRPREGDFFYENNFDYDVIKKTMEAFIEAGADGFVFGALRATIFADIQVDIEKSRFIVECALGLPCTFHRAFDLIGEQDAAINTLVDLGYKRILTSGLPGKAIDYSYVLENLHSFADDRITILPGGGIRSTNVEDLLKLGFKEIHSACVDSNAVLDKRELAELLQKIRQ
jgi:copper homeostasis protein